jgi:hypothetical protein
MEINQSHIIDKGELSQKIWAKRLFVLSLVLLGITFTLQGIGIIRFSAEQPQQQVKPIRAGGLMCEMPVWNFGSIDSVQHPKLSHEFVLTNESKETIIIKKIHSTCGCMVADNYVKELQAGKSTKIKVDVQLPSTPQIFQKSLAIQTDQSVLPLDVVGEITANSSLYSVPAKINFGEIQLGETKERIVQIFRYDLQPLLFTKAVGNIPNIECNINSELVEKNFKIDLSIRLVTNQMQSGYFEGNIVIHTEKGLGDELRIPVVAVIKKDDKE